MSFIGVVGLVTALAQAPLALRSVERGEQSNVDEERQVVVRTAADWTTLWRQHSPDRPRPSVDFGREMVVGVFLGSRPTSGFAVEIVEIAAGPDGLVARYRVTRPAAGAIAAQVLVFPYHLVAVPTSSATITFTRAE